MDMSTTKDIIFRAAELAIMTPEKFKVSFVPRALGLLNTQENVISALVAGFVYKMERKKEVAREDL